MQIEICFSKSGFGLSRDAQILKQTMRHIGLDPHIEPVKSKSSYSSLEKLLIFFLRASNALYFFRSLLRAFNLIQKNSLTVHLENISYLKLFSRGIHVLIPNQEWYDPYRLDLLRYVTSVWCKTHLAETIFDELGCRTQYLGFRSEVDDNLTKLALDSSFFFSRTGMSANRGAESLIETWRKNPSWPTLKLVIHHSRRPEVKPHNVEYLDIFESKLEYDRMASCSLFHIYLTETEGFGHSIVEALGYGAIVIALDAPPMNEILNHECALLVKGRYLGQKRLSPRFGADIESLELTIKKALTLGENDIKELSNNAKARYATLSGSFTERLQSVLHELNLRIH